MAYFLYHILFLLKRIRTRKNIVSLSEKDALDRISKVYPKPISKPIVNNPEINRGLDLSIVVPVYNYENLIRQNIESILNQKTSYQYELILVDDGSTDGAGEILKEYADRENVTVVFQSNMGIAGARNTGINHASGRYLMFADCDDLLNDEIVERLLKRAYEQDCDIVMCAHDLVKEKDGQVISVLANIYPPYNLLGFKNNDQIMNYAGLPWAKVYKRELFNCVRFFPGYWYEDTIIQFLLFTQCKRFSYIPYVGYEYKWYEKNFSHTQNSSANVKSIDRYWMLLDIIEKYKELGLPLDAQFYTMLIRHVSIYYYPQLKGLPKGLLEALFILAREQLIKYRPEQICKLPYMLKVTEKALLERDINLWKLATKYQ
ncbi:MAG: glycosyltransferase [Aeriscardovia sp.]|nr:glycosyltransferase [Aeriscardovia sp.]